MSNKSQKIAFGLLMAFFMSMVMSFVMVLINSGLSKTFLLLWAKSYIIGFVVAIPTAMIAALVSQKIIGKFDREH